MKLKEYIQKEVKRQLNEAKPYNSVSRETVVNILSANGITIKSDYTWPDGNILYFYNNKQEAKIAKIALEKDDVTTSIEYLFGDTYLKVRNLKE